VEFLTDAGDAGACPYFSPNFCIVAGDVVRINKCSAGWKGWVRQGGEGLTCEANLHERRNIFSGCGQFFFSKNRQFPQNGVSILINNIRKEYHYENTIQICNSDCN
jgi:hypothetical protein